MANQRAVVSGTTSFIAEISGADTLEVATGGLDTASGPLVLQGASSVVQIAGANTLDAATIDRAGTISIGVASATGITIGSGGAGGVLTTIAGDLSVTGNETVVGTTTFQDDVQLGNDATDRITVGGRFGTAGVPDLPFSEDANHQINVEQNTGDGGAGLSLTVVGGQGGDAVAAPGGVGGVSGLTGGAGGAGAVGLAAGAGGQVSITGGAGGTIGTTTGGVGGSTVIRGGAGTGAEADGAVTIGDANTSAVNLAASGVPTIVNDALRGPDDGTGLVLGHVGTVNPTGSAPQMISVTTTERAFLVPANGMQIYNSTTGTMQMYVSGAWSSVGTGFDLSGTPNLSWTVNNDGGTTNEDAALALYSGDGTSAFQGFWTLNATTDPPVLEYSVTDDAARRSPILGVGAAGETADIDAEILFNSGTGAGAEQASIKLDGTTDDLEIGTGATSVSTTVNLDAEAGLDVSGGAQTFTGTNMDFDPTGTVDFDLDAAQTFTVTSPTSGGAITLNGARIADSVVVTAGGGNYIEIDADAGNEGINLGNASTNPFITQLGTGQVTFAGNVDSTVGLDVTGGDLTLNGSGNDISWLDTAGNPHSIGSVQAADNTTGGAFSVSSQQGGDGAAAIGRASGSLTLQSGDGGAGVAGFTAGSSGGVTLKSGDGGTHVDTAGGNTGNVTIDVGAPTGSGTAGDITVGSTNVANVNIGNTSSNPPINFNGTGTVSLTGTGQKLELSDDGFIGIDERATDPTTAASEGALYTKDDGGATHLFYRTESDGTVYQITPVQPANAEYTGTAGETLAVGESVCIDWDAGNTQARVYQTDANGTDERSNAIGICTTAATAGTATTVQLTGESPVIPDAEWDSTPATTDAGKAVWMSETAGNVTLTKPTTASVTQQQIGWLSVGGTGACKLVVNTSVQLTKAA